MVPDFNLLSDALAARAAAAAAAAAATMALRTIVVF
eukprot:COSAG06_NODE_27474_length_592_cov_1.458418_1_plen_35_part_10